MLKLLETKGGRDSSIVVPWSMCGAEATHQWCNWTLKYCKGFYSQKGQSFLTYMIVVKAISWKTNPRIVWQASESLELCMASDFFFEIKWLVKYQHCHFISASTFSIPFYSRPLHFEATRRLIREWRWVRKSSFSDLSGTYSAWIIFLW